MKSLLPRNPLFWWYMAVVLTFMPIAFLSMHTGDDLGYMFADSVHHGGDGSRVTTLWQCITTQISHYHTTNGRFLIHVIVMAFINLLPLWLYRVVNALLFGLLWLASVRLCVPRGRRPGAVACALVWFALWLCLPQPGMVWGTLVAYAVNYLWVLTAYAWWFVALRKFIPGHTYPHSQPPSRPWWLYIATFLLGTLHEGFGLPVLCGLGVAWLAGNRGLWRIILPFVLGVAVCVAAPGNFAHAAQGGGMAVGALVHKCRALGFDLLISPAAWLLICVLLRRKGTLTGYAIVFSALALACLTFTSPRQLTLPMWVVVIMGVRAFLPCLEARRGKFISPTLSVLTIALISTIFALKLPVYNRYCRFTAEARTRSVLVINRGAAPNRTLPAWLRRAWAPDPLDNQGLVTIGDRYTADGLSRLYHHPVKIVASK